MIITIPIILNPASPTSTTSQPPTSIHSPRCISLHPHSRTLRTVTLDSDTLRAQLGSSTRIGSAVPPMKTVGESCRGRCLTCPRSRHCRPGLPSLSHSPEVTVVPPHASPDAAAITRAMAIMSKVSFVQRILRLACIQAFQSFKSALRFYSLGCACGFGAPSVPSAIVCKYIGCGGPPDSPHQTFEALSLPLVLCLMVFWWLQCLFS